MVDPYGFTGFARSTMVLGWVQIPVDVGAKLWHCTVLRRGWVVQHGCPQDLGMHHSQSLLICFGTSKS